MDLLSGTPTPFVIAASEWLQRESMTVVDVGCAGGVGPAWLGFGNKLRVFGFDSSSSEIAALTAEDHRGDHRYFNAFVTLPSDHPFAQSRGDRAHLQNNPWQRLAIDWWQQLREDRTAAAYDPARSVNVEIKSSVPKGAAVVDLPTTLRDVDAVDYIKIDVGGADLVLLHSLDEILHSKRVLALGVEVNFFGTSDPTCNTFCNVDRFLRDAGFELFDLSTRRYSNRALPGSSRSLPYPAETAFGRILQGDAFYARDLGASALAAGSNFDSVVKLAAIFSLFNLPDCAAELLVRFQSMLGDAICGKGLDLLAAQAAPGESWTYQDYLEAFRNGHSFFQT